MQPDVARALPTIKNSGVDPIACCTVMLTFPQVLRFFGFFQEAVTESNIENHRVRRVVVLYYLADDTLQVTEPKQDNSGIPQV